MKKTLIFLLSLALLTGCAGPAEEAEPSPTVQSVLAAYGQAAQVYDWFDLGSLPTGMEAIQIDNGIYYPVEEPGVETLADLEARVRDCFSPELAEEILSRDSGYREIDGRLFSASGARGETLYLMAKTVTAEPVSQDHWAVTLTFWADYTDRAEEDGWNRAVAVTGYSQSVLDYEKTESGWRFSTFCSSDGLDLEADTVFAFDYGQAMAGGSWRDYSDWQLVCYLIHAQGASAEAPSELLFQRFCERPEEILRVLALLDQSPYRGKYPAVGGIITSPARRAAALSAEEQTAFADVLDSCQPQTQAEQAVLDQIRSVFSSAV